MLNLEADPRKIHWFWEETGHVGKSFLSTHLGTLGATVLEAGKKANLSYIWMNQVSKMAVFDIPRTCAPSEGREHALDGIYSLAEA